MTRTTCRTSGKVRHRDRLAALIALARRNHNDKGEVRAYRCPDCAGWHLTSKKRWR